jgi:hypothetical protein
MVQRVHDPPAKAFVRPLFDTSYDGKEVVMNPDASINATLLRG